MGAGAGTRAQERDKDNNTDGDGDNDFGPYLREYLQATARNVGDHDAKHRVLAAIQRLKLFDYSGAPLLVASVPGRKYSNHKERAQWGHWRLQKLLRGTPPSGAEQQHWEDVQGNG